MNPAVSLLLLGVPIGSPPRPPHTPRVGFGSSDLPGRRDTARQDRDRVAAAAPVPETLAMRRARLEREMAAIGVKPSDYEMWELQAMGYHERRKCRPKVRA